jgi:hypothetical protein
MKYYTCGNQQTKHTSCFDKRNEKEIELSAKPVADDRSKQSRRTYLSSSGVNAQLLDGLHFGTDCRVTVFAFNIAVSSAGGI